VGELARRPAGVVDGFVLLPLGASAVMLGFGFLIAFDEGPLDFRSSWWLVPVAQSLIAAPFVVRIVTPALRSIVRVVAVPPKTKRVCSFNNTVPSGIVQSASISRMPSVPLVAFVIARWTMEPSLERCASGIA